MANTKEPSATLLGSIARPKPAARLGEPKRISDFVVAGSYNWLDEKDPTILVPGVPPIWSPPATAPVLKPDSGIRYVDQNGDRVPGSPLDSLILAVQTYQPDFDFAAIDLVSDRRPIRKLYGFVTSEPEAFEFGVEIVGNTALFIRMERQTREELPSTTFHGYRQAFEEQYTKLSASAKGSTSHHRIAKYKFGGLVLLVRSGVDAYLQELVKGPGSPEKTGVEDFPDHDSFLKTLSISSRVAIPTETKEGINGQVTVAQGGQKLADLWISQTPNFIEAYHQTAGYKPYNQTGLSRGKFEDIKVKSMGDQLAKWETANATALGGLALVLGQIIQEVKKAQGPCIVRYTGQGDTLGVSTIEGLPSLSKDLKSIFGGGDQKFVGKGV